MSIGPADLDRALGARRRGRFWESRRHRQTAALVTSAILAPLVGGEPTGSQLLDWGWSAALAGLGAYLAVRCKRGPLLALALVAVLSARTFPALAFGAASVVFASTSTRHLRRRAVFARGMAGGTGVISVLATAGHASALLFAVRALPDVLGGSGPRRYLVIFTSPAEARGRFGFPGSFAEVTFDEGRFRLGEHGSTSQLLNSTTYDQGDFDLGAQQLRPYLAYGSTRTVLSSTISPDFPTVAEVLGRMWVQSGRKPVDGVVRFDPT
jgi:hypothetical protein